MLSKFYIKLVMRTISDMSQTGKSFGGKSHSFHLRATVGNLSKDILS
jgi:hypothetical protein